MELQITKNDYVRLENDMKEKHNQIALHISHKREEEGRNGRYERPFMQLAREHPVEMVGPISCFHVHPLH